MISRELPGRKSQKHSPLAGCMLVLVLATLVLAVFITGYVLVASNQPNPTLPSVMITAPMADEQVASNNLVFIEARAEDPDRISKVEFYVNGRLIGTQASTVPQGVTPFVASQVWRPSAPGGYTILARASDTKGYSGQSTVVLLERIDKPPFDPEANRQIITQPGNTVASIARDNGTTPDEVRRRNPSLGSGEPAPGTSVMVPPTPETGPADDTPPGGGPSDIPVVGPPDAPPPPPPGGTAPAAPYIPPIFTGVGRVCFLVPFACTAPGLRPRILGRLECVVSPELCLTSPPGGSSAEPLPDLIGSPLAGLCDFMPGIPSCREPAAPGGRMPTAPRAVSATLRECRVEVRWTDDATDELGYRVFRDTELVAIVGPGATSAVDAGVTPGAFRYSVRVFNSTSENSSGETDLVRVPADCRRAMPTETLEIEALRMDVAGTFGGVYCYVALGGLPYERIPDVGMMTLRDGHTNIADYLGGDHKRRLSIPRAAGLEIIADCYGSSAGAAVALPRYQTLLGETYWDGREVTGSVTEGGQRLAVIYRVTRLTEETREGRPMPIIDARVPMPYNLRFGERRACSGGGGGPGRLAEAIACTESAGLGLVWDWNMDTFIPGYSTRDWWQFRVYRRLAPAAFSRISDAPAREPYHYSRYPEKNAPLANTTSCVTPLSTTAIDRQYVVAQTVYYSVQAVLNGTGPFPLESEISDQIAITASGCPDFIEVELTDLQTFTVCDAGQCSNLATALGHRGSDPVESYGYIDITEGIRFFWNCPHCGRRERARIYPDERDETLSYERPRVPQYVTLASNQTLPSYWRYALLKQEWATGQRDTQFSQNNNRVIFPIRNRTDPVHIRWWFYDTADVDGEDLWCSESGIDFTPNQPGGWTVDWQSISWTPNRTDTDGNCAVSLRVRLLSRR